MYYLNLKQNPFKIWKEIKFINLFLIKFILIQNFTLIVIASFFKSFFK